MQHIPSTIEEQLILRAIKEECPWESLPKRLQATLNSKEEWHRRIIDHCIKKRLQWSTCFARKVCKEGEYYEELRKNLALFPYHLAEYVCRVMRVSPFRYYCDMIFEVMKNGETADISIKALCFRQMKNFHMALMISQGTPMMLMGDEYGHTRYGNNNSYGHDTAINHFQWGQLQARKRNCFRFFAEMIKFRQKHRVFKQEQFIGKNEVTWHEDNWDNYESKFIAFTLHNGDGGDIYLAFNVHDYFVRVAVPSPPQKDTRLE